jgi:hypothetical protein
MCQPASGIRLCHFHSERDRRSIPVVGLRHEVFDGAGRSPVRTGSPGCFVEVVEDASLGLSEEWLSALGRGGAEGNILSKSALESTRAVVRDNSDDKWSEANPAEVSDGDMQSANSGIRYANKRAEMWGRMRDWLDAGAMLDDDKELASELVVVEYGYAMRDGHDCIILEREEARSRFAGQRGCIGTDICSSDRHGGSTVEIRPAGATRE